MRNLILSFEGWLALIKLTIILIIANQLIESGVSLNSPITGLILIPLLLLETVGSFGWTAELKQRVFCLERTLEQAITNELEAPDNMVPQPFNASIEKNHTKPESDSSLTSFKKESCEEGKVAA
ncbi:hypothetical protein [Aliikangiella sp. G2MR2-5]|uniref:hypothetical protein n=1 Tax=Aliikangiella sp. G2MR2-5 TaxID=2788943 RepID=UPI0018A93840|nr:hypothetical protein [Aliikangiella sp. G2MR2-5]